MNIFLIILFVVVILVISGLIYYFSLYNKINETIIRVDEAEARIDNNLRDKYDLIVKCIALLKNKAEVDNKAFKEIFKLKSRKISNFELDRVLVASFNEFLTIYESDKELKGTEELYRAVKQIEVIDDELITLRNYYNANILNYNKMIKTFPTLFIAKIKKYKERPFYDLKDRKDEDYEDFKL